MVDDKNVQQKDGLPDATVSEPESVTIQSESTVTQPGKQFDQSELDRIVKERLERERQKYQKTITEKYGDYDKLKEAAKKLQDIEDANKSELEKAAEKATKLEQRVQEIEGQNARLAQERTDALIKSAIVSAATRMNFTDPSDAYAMIDLAQIKVKDDTGEIEGVEALLKALAEAKPYLLQQQGTQRITLAPTNPGAGQQTGETPEQRRRRLFGTEGVPFGKLGGGMRISSKTE